MARARVVGRLEDGRKTISTPHRITFGTLFGVIVIFTRARIFGLVKHWDCLEILPANPKWAPFFYVLIKIRRFVILLRRGTKYPRVDVSLLAEAYESGPVAEHGGFIIDGITEYINPYLCLDSLGDRGAFPKLKQALAVELFKIDLETCTLLDDVVIIFFYIMEYNRFHKFKITAFIYFKLWLKPKIQF